MTDTQKKIFVEDLRRLLYVSKIALNEAETMINNQIAPKYMKSCANGIRNAAKRLFSDCMANTSPENWELVKFDLSKDQLNDISQMLEFMAGINNVGEVYEVLQEHLKTQIA